MSMAICCPDLANAKIVWAWYPVNQAHAHCAHLLCQHLSLWLDHLSVVRSHELSESDEQYLPLARRLCMQQVLMDVGGHNGLGLHVHEIFAPVRLELNGHEVVHLDVPQRLAEDGGSAIERPPSCIACPLNVRLILRQLCRNFAVKTGMRRLGLGHGVVV